MFTLQIDPKEFDKVVWTLDNAEIPIESYNGTMQMWGEVLSNIYNNEKCNDALAECGIDVYLLGDMINFFGNINVVEKK